MLRIDSNANFTIPYVNRFALLLILDLRRTQVALYAFYFDAATLINLMLAQKHIISFLLEIYGSTQHIRATYVICESYKYTVEKSESEQEREKNRILKKEDDVKTNF